MSSCYAISRIASYKFSGCGGVLKEALRTLPNYDNPDCDPSKSHLNVALIEYNSTLSPEKYILKYREDNNIKGRFNTVATNPKNLTNVMCQCLFTASHEYLDRLTREEQIEYFERCLEFFKKEFPSVHIVAANIHFDETTPHMHTTFLPTIERVKKKTGELETIFSTTQLMPGKDFFPKYQDRFYEYISSMYDGFERGESDRENMSVKQFKEYKELEKKYLQVKADLNALKEEKRWFDSIPLLGKFLKSLRCLKLEQINYILSEAIDMVKFEEKYLEEEQCSSVDDLIGNAKSRVELAENKKSILQGLFGKKNVDIDISK